MFSQSRLGHQAAVLKQVRHSVFSVQVLSMLGIGIAYIVMLKREFRHSGNVSLGF